MGKIPIARRFPKRISQEELQNRTTEYMNNRGADNHYRAAYYFESCKEAQSNQDPKFYFFQPNIQHQDGENMVWNRALSLVYSYLKNSNMDITLKCMNHEFKKSPVLKNLEDIPPSNVENEIQGLIALVSSLKEISFENRVQEMKIELESQISDE